MNRTKVAGPKYSEILDVRAWLAFKIAVLQEVRPCGLVETCWRDGGSPCLNLESSVFLRIDFCIA
jgi:hypothetical protein